MLMFIFNLIVSVFKSSNLFPAMSTWILSPTTTMLLLRRLLGESMWNTLVCLGVYDNLYIKPYLFMKNFTTRFMLLVKMHFTEWESLYCFCSEMFFKLSFEIDITEMNKRFFINKDENQDVELLSVTAVCYPSCQHGGRCVSPNTCHCPNGYSGHSCNIRMLIIIYFYFKLLQVF